MPEIESSSIKQVISKKLVDPTYVFRPAVLADTINNFKNGLPAKILYAVKTNNQPLVIKALCELGITNFDVASLNEIKLIHSLVDYQRLYFMNPVKDFYAIQEAYYKYGVRDFSFDHEIELDKIVNATNRASDLNLHLRLSIENVSAKLDLSRKFGASLKVAPALLHQASQVARDLGVSFHVGSQCMNPKDYYHAIIKSSNFLKENPVKVKYLNIGGGFPSAYPDLTPPPLDDYFLEIKNALSHLTNNYEILSEPGRALVAESMSLIVKVILRKKNTLYVNDGIFGGLYDAGALKFRYPVRLISNFLGNHTPLSHFDFYGPTCDSMDYMPGPFLLPFFVNQGDYIEIGQMGAYSSVFSSGFNGYGYNKQIFLINDPPILTYTSKRALIENCQSGQRKYVEERK